MLDEETACNPLFTLGGSIYDDTTEAPVTGKSKRVSKMVVASNFDKLAATENKKYPHTITRK